MLYPIELRVLFLCKRTRFRNRFPGHCIPGCIPCGKQEDFTENATQETNPAAESGAVCVFWFFWQGGFAAEGIIVSVRWASFTRDTVPPGIAAR